MADAAPKYASGLDDPSHYCGCGAWGAFGQGGRWFCADHRPADFYAYRDGHFRAAVQPGPSMPQADLPLMRAADRSGAGSSRPKGSSPSHTLGSSSPRGGSPSQTMRGAADA